MYKPCPTALPDPPLPAAAPVPRVHDEEPRGGEDRPGRLYYNHAPGEDRRPLHHHDQHDGQEPRPQHQQHQAVHREDGERGRGQGQDVPRDHGGILLLSPTILTRWPV